MATFTIANGASTSDTIDLNCVRAGSRVVAIVMPSGWTAAALTFSAGLASDSLNDIYDQGGTELNFTVGASRYVVLDQDQAANLTNIRFLRLRSGTAGTPVTQGAARTIEVITA